MPETLVVLSVDTESDSWEPTRSASSVENIRELPRLQAFCDRLGIPVTYFTSYSVAADSWAVGVMRDLQATGRAEVAAHLHPWNTPPLDEPMLPRNTMLSNLPVSLQRPKLATITRTIEEGIGVRPRAFRAGRFGLGRETTKVLVEQGYLVDSSVTPWTSWTDTDEGPDFIGAPLSPYCLDGTTDPRVPVPGGPLLEIPLSCGYTRWPFEGLNKAYQTLRLPWMRPFHLAGLASRLGLVRAVSLQPEAFGVRDMLRLAKNLVEHEVPVLSVFFHSPSLLPGLSPFSLTRADVERLFSTLGAFTDALGRVTTPVFTTASCAASRLGGSVLRVPVAK